MNSWQNYARKLECLDCGSNVELFALAKPKKIAPNIHDVKCLVCINKIDEEPDNECN